MPTPTEDIAIRYAVAIHLETTWRAAMKDYVEVACVDFDDYYSEYEAETKRLEAELALLTRLSTFDRGKIVCLLPPSTM